MKASLIGNGVYIPSYHFLFLTPLCMHHEKTAGMITPVAFWVNAYILFGLLRFTVCQNPSFEIHANCSNKNGSFIHCRYHFSSNQNFTLEVNRHLLIR
jgi:hypothetical protein